MSQQLAMIVKKDDQLPVKPDETVPYNLEAEQSLLGILLLDNSMMESVQRFLALLSLCRWHPCQNL